MRAIVCRALQGPDALELVDLPGPEPGACGVRIRVRAAGVNFADSLMLAGQYQEKPALPFTPGLELAGQIEAVGAGVRGLAPGQRVWRWSSHGASPSRRWRAPRTWSAAGRHGRRSPPPVSPSPTARRTAPCAGGPTCTRARAARARCGGGVGLTAVECGKAIGATVIATARGEEKLAVAREHGADADDTWTARMPDLRAASAS